MTLRVLYNRPTSVLYGGVGGRVRGKNLYKNRQLSHNLEHTNYNLNYIYKEAEMNLKQVNRK